MIGDICGVLTMFLAFGAAFGLPAWLIYDNHKHEYFKDSNSRAAKGCGIFGFFTVSFGVLLVFYLLSIAL